MTFDIRAITPRDGHWVTDLIVERWGSNSVVGHGVVYHPRTLPGFVATQDGRPMGLLTYVIEEDGCEIVTIDSLAPGMGVGTALVNAVKHAAHQADCRRLWLITTNDNLHALRFYQKCGFVLVAVHRNAIENSRRLKPEIPLIGHDGIPIRDEIELDMVLGDAPDAPDAPANDAQRAKAR